MGQHDWLSRYHWPLSCSAEEHPVAVVLCTRSEAATAAWEQEGTVPMLDSLIAECGVDCFMVDEVQQTHLVRREIVLSVRTEKKHASMARLPRAENVVRTECRLSFSARVSA